MTSPRAQKSSRSFPQTRHKTAATKKTRIKHNQHKEPSWVFPQHGVPGRERFTSDHSERLINIFLA